MRSSHNGEVADLIVVTGPPGAGKSTVGRILAGRYEASALVAGDQFFGFLDRGHITPWLPEADGQNTIVIEAAAAAAGRLAVAYMVVYDGAVGPWYESARAPAMGSPTWRRPDDSRIRTVAWARSVD